MKSIIPSEKAVASSRGFVGTDVKIPRTRSVPDVNNREDLTARTRGQENIAAV